MAVMSVFSMISSMSIISLTLAPMKKQMTNDIIPVTIASGYTSELHGQFDVLSGEEENDDDDFLLHKTMADFGGIDNRYLVSHEYLNGETKNQ
ncbi:unnamed protein product [Macrosiphum euphorbiae]|uniref:Uncharacterized protein n=1 Tax=Macrosiphum euphorbiae TaxID=13131 RepID=A0AAV0W3Y0_9HEMI|nr:unnamed protein product [Macrosiphum euphorbiae]